MHNERMDALVLQALCKWPNVPSCRGWLGLDVRGHWYLRDEETQRRGHFPQSKGERLQHEKLLSFIGRNYAADAAGQWYFQNGPQRVYVELENTPWIWRVQLDGTLHSTTATKTSATACLTDDEGRVYFTSGIGLGLVHSADVPMVADAIERGEWTPMEVSADRLPSEFGFVRSPSDAAANPLPANYSGRS